MCRPSSIPSTTKQTKLWVYNNSFDRLRSALLSPFQPRWPLRSASRASRSRCNKDAQKPFVQLPSPPQPNRRWGLLLAPMVAPCEWPSSLALQRSFAADLLATSSAQDEILRDLLDDLSDEEGAEPAGSADAQLPAPADAALPPATHAATAALQTGRSQPHGATASEPRASSADAGPVAPSASSGGLLCLPEDVLLCVLRRCARADWLSLACACGALRAAALRDELWCTQPELRRPATSEAGVAQHAMAAATGQGGATHGSSAAGSSEQPSAVAAASTPPLSAEPPSKRARRHGSSEGKQPGLGFITDRTIGPPSTVQAEPEKEPAVGSGGTYLGLSQRSDKCESHDAAEPRDCAIGGRSYDATEGADGSRLYIYHLALLLGGGQPH